MDGGVATAIAIAGLTLSLINTALVMVKFYIDQLQYSSITIEGDGYTVEKSNLTPDELNKIIKDIEKKKLKNIVVKVSSITK
jgi:coenzyme F420-reducing hydrogenase beta subunit